MPLDIEIRDHSDESKESKRGEEGKKETLDHGR